MADDNTKILYLLLGMIVGGVALYIILKLKGGESPSSVQFGRDKDGRIIDYTILPFPRKV